MAGLMHWETAERWRRFQLLGMFYAAAMGEVGRFVEGWQLAMACGLDDMTGGETLEYLLDHGFLRAQRDESQPFFALTAQGARAVEQVAVPAVAEAYSTLWPRPEPARKRQPDVEPPSATSNDHRARRTKRTTGRAPKGSRSAAR